MTASTRIALAAAASFTLAGGAGAQTAPLGDIQLDAIVVTATGRPERQSQVAGTTQVIDRERIEQSSSRARNR